MILITHNKTVTKKVTSTLCDVITLNLETCETRIFEVDVIGRFRTEKELRKHIDIPNVKIVKIENVRIKESYYAMPLRSFISLGVETNSVIHNIEQGDKNVIDRDFIDSVGDFFINI